MNDLAFRNNVLLRLEQIGKYVIGSSFYSADELSSFAFCDAMVEIIKIIYPASDEASEVYVNDEEMEIGGLYGNHAGDHSI